MNQEKQGMYIGTMFDGLLEMLDKQVPGQSDALKTWLRLVGFPVAWYQGKMSVKEEEQKKTQTMSELPNDAEIVPNANSSTTHEIQEQIT